MICLDAKVNFDSNALYRHDDIMDLRDLAEEDPAEVKASEFDLNYIKLDGTIGCMVNGAGLAMAGATLAAQYIGAGRREEVDKVSAQTLLMVLVMSTILGTCGYWLSPHFLTLHNLGNSHEFLWVFQRVLWIQMCITVDSFGYSKGSQVVSQ